MPLGRIEIEQLGGDRWVAEVEAGGTSARRLTVRATSFDDIVSEVIDAYRRFIPSDPKPKPAEPVEPVDELEIMRAQVADARTRVPVRRGSKPVPPKAARQERRAEPRPDDSDEEREALIARAETAGIEIDRRWGVSRLREAVRGNAPA